MKILLTLLACTWSLFGAPAHAEEPDIEGDPRVRIDIVEPARDVGYTVGDILQRTVTLEVQKPYTLIKTSLPIVGYERRYKGQVTGIELYGIDVEESAGSTATTYTLRLAYQVFTNNIVSKPAILPPEIIKFSGDGKQFDYRIPSWSFRISPLAVYGSVNVARDMSQFRGPLLKSNEKEQQYLKVLVAICALSLLGLIYILGMYRWLPRMGGPFARAYRDIRKAETSAQGVQQAIARVHQAFNTTAGFTVFNGNLDRLQAIKPGFGHLAAEIEQFFALSRQAFFESGSGQQNADDALAWLRQFCRRCRDIERGLK